MHMLHVICLSLLIMSSVPDGGHGTLYSCVRLSFAGCRWPEVTGGRRWTPGPRLSLSRTLGAWDGAWS